MSILLMSWGAASEYTAYVVGELRVSILLMSWGAASEYTAYVVESCE